MSATRGNKTTATQAVIRALERLATTDHRSARLTSLKILLARLSVPERPRVPDGFYVDAYLTAQKLVAHAGGLVERAMDEDEAQKSLWAMVRTALRPMGPMTIEVDARAVLDKETGEVVLKPCRLREPSPSTLIGYAFLIAVRDRKPRWWRRFVIRECLVCNKKFRDERDVMRGGPRKTCSYKCRSRQDRRRG